MSHSRSVILVTGVAALLFAAACTSGKKSARGGGAESGVRTVQIQAPDSLKFEPTGCVPATPRGCVGEQLTQ
jgi:hypothetical protein